MWLGNKFNVLLKFATYARKKDRHSMVAKLEKLFQYKSNVSSAI